MKKETGLSLIECALMVAILGIVAAIAIPNLLISGQAANEAGAIGVVREIGRAQATYLAVEGRGKEFAPTLSSLGNSGRLKQVETIQQGKYCYGFTMTGVASSNSETKVSYFDTRADPDWSGPYGAARHHFYSNEKFLVYGQSEQEAGDWDSVDPHNRIPLKGSTIY